MRKISKISKVAGPSTAPSTSFEDIKSSSVDITDVKILSLLQRDGRVTYKKIAKNLGIAIGTVHNRIVRMKKEGVIRKFVPVIDAGKLGFKVSALVAVRMKPGFYELEKRFEHHPNVFGVWTLTGEHDAMMLVRFSDTESLSNFIKHLQSHEEIEKTFTHIVLSPSKEEFSPNLSSVMHPLFEKKVRK